MSLSGSAIFWALLLLPAAGSGLILLLRHPRAVMLLTCSAALGAAVLAFGAAAMVYVGGPMDAARAWFHLDALSAYHLAVMGIVFALSSLYAPAYFRHALEKNELAPAELRRFAALWLGAQGAMTLTLISNNLGLMWVGIEATTLLTAFLICVHRTPAALEAMWKYLILCSVGVAFAFMGTLLVGAATTGQIEPAHALEWTTLVQAAPKLNTAMLKLAFLFLLVGYGTKAGLAPMHTWLPDAHSQAPAPVSALFSGFLLNCALYCILRCVPIVEGACGHSGWSLNLLVVFGLVSTLAAATFICFQKDVKRLLAYSTVEHMGIITLGVGLGGLGVFAALFHTLNHSLTKTLAFLGAGRVGQIYGTHEIARISGATRNAPVWGVALFAGLLGLIGAAPLPIFMSEFQIAKAAADRAAWWPLGLFLLAVGTVFVGALRYAISMAWGKAEHEVAPESAGRTERLIVALGLAALLLLGLWMPEALRLMIEDAALVIGGGS